LVPYLSTAVGRGTNTLFQAAIKKPVKTGFFCFAKTA